MECPHCNKEELVTFGNINFLNNIAYKKSLCTCCGYWELRSSEYKKYIEKSNCYTLEFSTISGDSGKFIGIKEEIHKQIDSYKWTGFDDMLKEDKLRMIAVCISFLKYGYLDDFRNSDYESYEITIDNGLWIKISYGIYP